MKCRAGGVPYSLHPPARFGDSSLGGGSTAVPLGDPSGGAETRRGEAPEARQIAAAETAPILFSGIVTGVRGRYKT